MCLIKENDMKNEVYSIHKVLKTYKTYKEQKKFCLNRYKKTSYDSSFITIHIGNLSSRSSICCPDSPIDWFQVELNKLYRFQTQLFSNGSPYPQKCEILLKTVQILVYPGPIHLRTGSNSTFTGSK
jgi:hypothetical protein